MQNQDVSAVHESMAHISRYVLLDLFLVYIEISLTITSCYLWNILYCLFLKKMLFISKNLCGFSAYPWQRRLSCPVMEEGHGDRQPRTPNPQPSSQDLVVARKWIAELLGYNLVSRQTAFIWESRDPGLNGSINGPQCSCFCGRKCEASQPLLF